MIIAAGEDGACLNLYIVADESKIPQASAVTDP